MDVHRLLSFTPYFSKKSLRAQKQLNPSGIRQLLRLILAFLQKDTFYNPGLSNKLFYGSAHLYNDKDMQND